MRVGIYGGTFDPVHNGHVVIATKITELLNLDKLIVMPAYIPPHKVERKRVEFSKRFKWLELAFKDLEKVEVSDFEGKKEKISYTIETVEHFEKVYGKLVYLIGEDNYLSIDRWYRYEDFLKKVELWIYPRSCNLKEKDVKRWAFISDDIHIAKDVPLIQISSTVIRERIKNGLTIRGYVPESIEKDVWQAYQ
ncbi:nicotinate (nicotinamide) nucleotide adenylyltransferase [Mesoaciditoga sp.]